MADRNFTQYPGFAEYFAANPPAEAAGPADRALARRHAPRFHLPAGHEGPIDFYRDYIAHGYLVTGDGVRIDGPTPAELNRYRDDVRAEFTHVPGETRPHPVVYAAVERTGLWAPREDGRAVEEFTVLAYHLVFRVSGLPAATPLALAMPLRLVADLDDWHQLDHYTAAFVVLDAAERPVALNLQQHNYLRTYLVGESVEPGPDGRFDIDVAIRSNELYPHVPGRTVRRAVRFLDSDARAFMMGFGKRPMMSADDVTDPRPERRLRVGVPPRLRCLLFLPRLPRRTPAAARSRRPAGGALQHHARAQTAARADPRRLLAGGERRRLGAVPAEAEERRGPSGFRPCPGRGLPPQPGLPAPGEERLHAAVAGLVSPGFFPSARALTNEVNN